MRFPIPPSPLTLPLKTQPTSASIPPTFAKGLRAADALPNSKIQTRLNPPPAAALGKARLSREKTVKERRAGPAMSAHAARLPAQAARAIDKPRTRGGPSQPAATSRSMGGGAGAGAENRGGPRSSPIGDPTY